MEYAAKLKADAEDAEEERKKKQAADMHRRLHPQTNDDFAILYNELDQWRREEVAKLKTRTSPGEERNDAMNALLADETKALTNIQRLKVRESRLMIDL